MKLESFRFSPKCQHQYHHIFRYWPNFPKHQHIFPVYYLLDGFKSLKNMLFIWDHLLENFDVDPPTKTDPFRPLKLPRPLKLGHGELGNDLHLRNPKGRWFSKRGKLMGIRDANVGSLGEISAARMGLTWFNMVQLHRQPHVIIH